MNNRRLVRSVLFLLLLGLLIGCAQQPAAPVQEPAEAPEEQAAEPMAQPTEAPAEQMAEQPAWYIPEYADRYGGVLKAAVSAAAPTLDTMTSMAAATVYSGQNYFETLVAYDEGYRVAPMLAESWDVSEDGRTWTFKLREGVTFHNGEEMTSDDVVASVDRYMDVGPRAGQFTLLESWEAVDDYTVKFELSEPSGSFLGSLAYPVGDLVIMPKDVIEGKAAGDLEVEDLIGTGPYKLVEWRPGEIIRMVRHDLYEPLPGDRGTDGLSGTKIPYFDEVQRIYVPEASARVAGVETGEYDWATGIPETEYERLQDTPNVTPYVKKAAWAYMILFNHANWPTSEPKFRQAVLATLDMESISRFITNGVEEFYRLNPSIWVPEGPWYVEDDPVAEELYNQNDPEKAKQLLDEIGYDGEEIVLVTNRDYDYMYKLIVAVADELEKKAGMNVSVEVLDWPGQRARWEEQETWHMSTTGYYSQVIFNPDALASFWHSESSSSERGFYENPEMNEAFDDAAKAIEFEDRKAAFERVQQIYYEDLPNIKIGDFFRVEVRRSDLQGLEENWYRTNRFWNIWREQ